MLEKQLIKKWLTLLVARDKTKGEVEGTTDNRIISDSKGAVWSMPRLIWNNFKKIFLLADLLFKQILQEETRIE